MKTYDTLAAVDLGSNSFRLEVARVAGDQLYPLDSLKETVRLAGGLGADKRLDDATQERALACLQRFGERLRGLSPEAIRCVGTSALRVAKNAGEFIPGPKLRSGIRSRSSPGARRRGSSIWASRIRCRHRLTGAWSSTSAAAPPNSSSDMD